MGALTLPYTLCRLAWMVALVVLLPPPCSLIVLAVDDVRVDFCNQAQHWSGRAGPIRPATSFMTQHNGGDCVSNTPAAVRSYFRSPSASGPSTGTPPAGFYTQFW